MMMVPRSFAATSPPRQSPLRRYDEKDGISVTTRIPKSRSPSPAKPPASPNSTSHARSVPTAAHRTQLKPSDAPASSPQRPAQTPVQTAPRRESVQEILAATAIPIRRRPRKRASQRLPDGDHVANFSSWLQDDIKAATGTPSSSYGAHFDSLFGSIDGLVDTGSHMYVGSEGVDSSILATRSVSTESMPSLASPDDSSTAGNSSVSPLGSRSPSYRKIRQIANSLDCAYEHPLMQDEEDDDGASTPELTLSPTPKSKRNESRRPSAFKSTLTASLKAIKSAAQSVSNYATPFNEPDMLHTPFDIRPSLTDDRRPPPSAEPPSPALRRYLNPNISSPPDSPAQLHFWTEHRSTKAVPAVSPPSSRRPQPSVGEDGFRPRPRKKHLKLQAHSTTADTSKLPSIVQLATCIPPAVRTAHASSPPIWLAPDGTPVNKATAEPLLFDPNSSNGPLKQREPRENRDFLRMFVCEMQMKRAGKLRVEAEGHARMWLPPVGEGTRQRANRGVERWEVWVGAE